MVVKYVIIGAGPAGLTAAETLREYGVDATISMVSREPYPPYSPPAMVEYFLTGSPVHFWKGKDITGRLGIDYHSGSKIRRIDRKQRQVYLENGSELPYDRLLIAAGSRLYTPLEGSDKEGIYNFKSLLAGEELVSRVRKGEAKTALIVGAGFIGVEIALLLRAIGVSVTMLVRSRVMRGMLDPETSQFVLEKIKERGIDVLTGDDADAKAFEGGQRAEALRMRSGRELTADLLVAATGLKPNLEFLSGSGIHTDWGIPVDDHLRTSDPSIFAAGDIAETVERISGRRGPYPNYPNAVAQGRVAGYNLLGWDVVYAGADSMNSLKHLGLPVMAGGIMEGEEMCLRRDGVLRKLWVKNDRLVGFRLAGDVSGAGIYLSLMRRKARISSLRDILLDPRFGMSYLAGTAFAPSLNPAL
ncbi:MAG TPA: NAD(P)/FAD-dependent oxidoreductase [Firmicutes bacterium]|nr:NAD(P)/FAD-dependent oxidoreductase [Bacillota bacterium]